MTKTHFKLLFALILTATLLLVASGCSGGGQDLEGKNIVTFELMGGTLETKTASVGTNINYAYHPGTYILDPSELSGYKIYRPEYDFTGWYTSEECNPEDKWDFGTPFNTETLTLYAGWAKSIKHTYTVYYVVGGSKIALGSYNASEGEAFEDWRHFASTRRGYTPMGYYSDIDFTTPWDESFTHPGGDEDCDVAVYVDYIEGNWALVDSFAELKDALKASENVYLLSDIDCGGEIMLEYNLVPIYSGTFEGNGFTVSNLKVEGSGGIRSTIAIFKTLGAGAEIRNVSFANVDYVLNVSANNKGVLVSAFANDALGAKITNVSVSGTITTNYTGEITNHENAVYKEDAVVEITDFTAEITIVNTNN